MDNIQPLIKLVNQVFDLEKKVVSKPDGNLFSRNFERIRESLSEIGFWVHNPYGESYNETRTDCEATIAGNFADKLVITEVIKPIIYYKLNDNEKHLVQRGVVIAEKL
jgi:hypothetical protein